VSNFSFQLNEGKHGMLLLSEQKSCPLEQFKGTVHPWEKQKTKNTTTFCHSQFVRNTNNVLSSTKHRKGNLAECFRCLFVCVCEKQIDIEVIIH